MKFPDFSLTLNIFHFQNFFPDRGNPVLRMKRVNLQQSSFKINSSWKQCRSWTDSFNGIQLLWIHSVTKKKSSRLSMTRLKSYKSNVCPQNN